MGTMIFYQMPEQGLHFGKMKEGAGVAENQLLHRLFFTSSPCVAIFCKSLIRGIRNFSGIVFGKAGFQICYTADITLFRLGNTA